MSPGRSSRRPLKTAKFGVFPLLLSPATLNPRILLRNLGDVKSSGVPVYKVSIMSTVSHSYWTLPFEMVIFHSWLTWA